MALSDKYRSIAAATQAVYKDRGSRFLAYAYPVEGEEQVKPLVDALKKEHHGARHHCYAYRIGCGGDVFRANDDGEPSGSAGRPILGAIDKCGCSDVLVVVVRYFGGILLGVPGLINAYREASLSALEAAAPVEKVRRTSLLLEFGYDDMDRVQRLVKGCAGAEVAGQNFDLQCSMTLRIPSGDAAAFMETINTQNNEKGTRIQCRTL